MEAAKSSNPVFLGCRNTGPSMESRFLDNGLARLRLSVVLGICGAHKKHFLVMKNHKKIFSAAFSPRSGFLTKTNNFNRTKDITA